MKVFASGAGRQLRILLGLLVGVGLVGCSKAGNYNPAGPSAIAPATEMASHASGTNRHYRAAITPTSVASGSSTSFALTITNCNEAACPGNPTSANQKIGSVEIVLPAGFTAAPGPAPTSATGGKTWTGTVVNGAIRLGASGGNQRLEAGESVTVTFTASAPSACTTYSWLTNAYQDPLSSVGELVRATPYELIGAQPQVEVTGCSAGCTLGQGYWKNNPQAWPVAQVMLGTVTYSATELLTIFVTPVAGNGLIQLAHQLIAAKLNIANGASGAAVAATVAAADALIGALVVPPVGAGSLQTSQTSALNDTLDAFNKGLIGPGACPQ
jgi:hypothetical protein